MVKFANVKFLLIQTSNTTDFNQSQDVFAPTTCTWCLSGTCEDWGHDWIHCGSGSASGEIWHYSPMRPGQQQMLKFALFILWLVLDLVWIQSFCDYFLILINIYKYIYIYVYLNINICLYIYISTCFLVYILITFSLLFQDQRIKAMCFFVCVFTCRLRKDSMCGFLWWNEAVNPLELSS